MWLTHFNNLPNLSKINCKTYHHNETIHQENRRKNHISNKGISLSLHAFLRESREKLLPNTQKNKFQPHQPNKKPKQHIDLKKELKTKARQKKIYKEHSYAYPVIGRSTSFKINNHSKKKEAQNQCIFSLYLIHTRISSSNQSK